MGSEDCIGENEIKTKKIISDKSNFFKKQIQLWLFRFQFALFVNSFFFKKGLKIELITDTNTDSKQCRYKKSTISCGYRTLFLNIYSNSTVNMTRYLVQLLDILYQIMAHNQSNFFFTLITDKRYLQFRNESEEIG